MDPRTNPFAPGAGAPPPARWSVGMTSSLRLTSLFIGSGMAGPRRARCSSGCEASERPCFSTRSGKWRRISGTRARQAGSAGGTVDFGGVPGSSSEEHADAIEPHRKGQGPRRPGAWCAPRFASAFKVSIGELRMEVSESSIADSGNLEIDLPALLVAVGRAARAGNGCVAILVDEIQYLTVEDLRALIVAFHMISQGGLPVILFGAGLAPGRGACR